jgi:hypothetical protein
MYLIVEDFLMSDVEQMQKTLDKAISKIDELNDLIKELKVKPNSLIELKILKKQLATQQRIKITIIQSIEELSPSNKAMIPHEGSTATFFSRVKNIFTNLFMKKN